MTNLLPTTRKPDVTLHADGRIDIAARPAKLLGLQAGDVIGIALDERTSEAYLYVRHRNAVGRHEAQVYPTNRRGKICNNYRCHSKRITSRLLGDERQDARLPAGDIVETPSFGPALPLVIHYKIKKTM